jgi:hypothetical protein
MPAAYCSSHRIAFISSSNMIARAALPSNQQRGLVKLSFLNAAFAALE